MNWLSIALTLLLVLFTSKMNAGETIHIENWQSLQLEISKIPVSQLMDAEKIKSNLTLNNIFNLGSPRLFREMTRVIDYPLVQIFGVSCLLRNNEKKLAYTAAVEIVLTADKPMSPILDLIYSLLKVKYDGISEILLLYISKTYAKKESLYVLLIALPPEEIAKMIENKDFENWPVINQAVIFDLIYSYSAEKKMTVPEFVKNGLVKFADIPGIPRLVYLMYGEDGDEMYLRNFVSIIESTDITDIELYGLLISKRDFIRSNRSQLEVHFNPTRAALFKKAIKPRESRTLAVPSE